MAIARTWAIALHGVAGHLIAVEADIAHGLPGTTVIGLGDTAVAQARDRVRAAVLNAGHRWPQQRITLALSPAGIPKKGAGFDLAMAVALLAADEVIPPGAAGSRVLIGELGLDGAVRPVAGVLPCLLAARAEGMTSAVVPCANLSEAALADGISVRGAATLTDLVAFLRGGDDDLLSTPADRPVWLPEVVPDMADVLGQPEARAALELAAAGGHHLAMIGPPGAGKTMLASRLPGLLPPLDAAQALEVTAIHSVAGRLDPSTPLISRPPFVDPHHSASLVAMVGGGSGLVRPGSISLAHRGVLFLDESSNVYDTIILVTLRWEPQMSQPVAHPRPPRPSRTLTYPPYRDYGVELAPGTRPIVLYLRLSKYHADGADAIDRQRLDLTRKLATEGGWTVSGEFVDNDSASVSAVRTRKGWVALNQAISVGAVKAVAFWKLDRTNRVAARIIEWLGDCRANGVTLVSHEDSSTELNEASANAKLVVGIKSLFAEIETDTMSARQKAAKRHAAEAGFNHGGTCPFGWRIGNLTIDEHGRSGTRLVPDPVEFPALQDAVRMVIDGASLNDVARHWQDTYGITSARGARIPAANIRRYLTSPRLMGYRMRQVPEFERGVKLDLLNFIARDARGEPVISQEPVCDRLAWMRLQKAISEGHTGPRGPWGKNEWLLTGLLRCGTCRAPLFGRTRKERSGSPGRRYGCLASLAWRPGTCARTVTIEASAVENYLLGWVVAHLTPARLAEQEALLDQAVAGSPIARLTTDLDEARLELDHLLKQQGTDRWKGAKVAILLGMIGDVSDRIDKLDSAITKARSGTGLVTGDTLLERWPRMTLNQKRIMLGRVVDHAVVLPGRGAPRERLEIVTHF